MERDPNGMDAHQPGAKLDAGKPLVGLVLGGFARALTKVAEVGTFGAKKYTPMGWVQVPDGEARYTDALYRHLLKEAEGEAFDPDSKLLHAAHAAWNALARLDLILREMENYRASLSCTQTSPVGQSEVKTSYQVERAGLSRPTLSGPA